MENDSYMAWRLRLSDVFDLIPEWRDRERAKREASWLIAYLVGTGLSYDAAANMGDPERIKRARDALVSSLKHPRRDGLWARR